MPLHVNSPSELTVACRTDWQLSALETRNEERRYAFECGAFSTSHIQQDQFDRRGGSFGSPQYRDERADPVVPYGCLLNSYLSGFPRQFSKAATNGELRIIIVGPRASIIAAEPGAKRRKLRKGTRSCWECQEFPEEHAPYERRGTNKSDDRLQRLEELVEELSQKVSSGIARQEYQAPLALDESSNNPHASKSTNRSPNSEVMPSQPSAAIDLAAACSQIFRNNPPGDGRIRIIGTLQSSPPRPLVGSSLAQFGGTTDKSIAPLVHALVSAWPTYECHNDAILSSDVGSLHPALSSSCSGFRTAPSPKEIFQLPPPGAAPVAIARKLLILGAFLQVISSQRSREKSSKSPEYHVLSAPVFETVNKLVTHNDNLPESVEIIECLIIESQHHNYMGNIRRSWIVLRRAMAMAQMLGLDRQSKVLDANADKTCESPYEENIWFLLVHFDQYLSLLLGISPNLPEYSQPVQGRLESCTPSGRMGRLHSMAAGRILQRNRINPHDTAETKEIDNILQMAAACMPIQWWSSPDWSDDYSDAGFSDVIDRLMVQFAHYNILLQAHLPYMFYSLGKHRYSCGTPIVINSSREILTRFTTFRSRYPAVSYCRGLDIFTFVSSIALCLLHIYASYQNRVASSSDSVGISILLAHQRFAHRGLMERALQSIEKIAQIEPDDKITSNIVPVFRKLLDAEEKAYRGVGYSIQISPQTGQPKNGGQRVTNNSDTLFLEVPFCGTIGIMPLNAPNTSPTEVPSPGGTTQRTQILIDPYPPSAIDRVSTLPMPEDQQALATETCHVDQNQSNVGNAYTMIPVSPDLRVVPCDGDGGIQGSISALGQIGLDKSVSSEELLGCTIDPSCFEHLWDIQ
ncbi:hypothetical protein NUW58_g3973 [Xylaria curta]|uniref:Uncharacterized protein n=1 Tax=Xylaria curta TaxID=42375 RepID=A0ACC1PAS4_9PEZI|nr:hypothetical protein NUW58_g3973 [Xylaria curta]